MNVVYMIGNGFDIACGLDTSAASIIEQYKTQLKKELEDDHLADSDHLQLLADSISNNQASWSDFEMKLGEVTSLFELAENPIESFEAGFAHFRSFLIQHLVAQQSRIDGLDFTENAVRGFQDKALNFFRDELRPNQRRILDAFIQSCRNTDWNVDFIVFNYTLLIDMIVDRVDDNRIKRNVGYSTYGRYLRSPLHIHGTLIDDYGIVVGVDNEAQIKSKVLRNDSSLTDSLVKTNLNEYMDLGRDEAAMQLINRANLIIIHGMSIGKSDMTWWKCVGEWLLDESRQKILLLSEYVPGFSQECRMRPEVYRRTVDTCKEKFISAAHIPSERIDAIYSKILVVINANAFNIGLHSLITQLQ